MASLHDHVVPGDRTAVKELLQQRYGISLDPEPESEDTTSTAAGDLDFRSQELLISINERPCLTQSQREKDLGRGWYARKIHHRKNKLLEMGLITETEVTTSSGATAKYHVLTEAGRDVVKELGETPQTLHGSVEHHCYIVELAQSYGQTFKTYFDMQRKGFRPDLMCKDTSADENGLVEVMTTLHLKDDMQKLRELANEFDWIHIYCAKDATTKAVTKALQEHLPQSAIDKTLVRNL